MTDYLLAYAAGAALSAAYLIANPRTPEEVRTVILLLLFWPATLAIALWLLSGDLLHSLRFQWGCHATGRRWGIGRTTPHPGVWLALWGRAVFVWRVRRP